MKLIITESQYSNLIRRRYTPINDILIYNLKNFDVCQYKYEDGLYDFFNDVKHETTIDVMHDIFSMTFDDAQENGQEERFIEIYEETDNYIFDHFFTFVEEYYNIKIKSC